MFGSIEGLDTDECPVYHQESLIIGNATRALQCTNVVEWHLNRNSLAWLSSHAPESVISIGDLKSPNGVSTKAFNVMALESSDLSSWQCDIRYVQLAPDGELLVHLSALEGTPTESDVEVPGVARVEELVKLSRDKTIAWRITFKAMLNRAAISKDAIYLVRDREQPPSELAEAAFVKVNLKDGSIIYEVPLPSDPEIGVPYRNTSLALMADKSMAIWNDLAGKIHIFSTLSGQVLQTINRKPTKDLILSSNENKFWSIEYEGVSSVGTYDKETNTFVLEDLLPRPFLFSNGSCFDSDRPIFCSIMSDTPVSCQQSQEFDYDLLATTLDPFSTIWIAAKHQSTLKYLVDCRRDEFKYITLPPRSAKEKERRHLEAELPRYNGTDTFFGMCEDFLVFHSRSVESLLLVDFWPTW